MAKNHKKLIIYTDGGARGNPGPAGIGAVIYTPDKKKLFSLSKYIGEATNNVAEYTAVIAAFNKAAEAGAEELEFYLDSELVVRQLNHEYKVKNRNLASLFVRIHNESLKYKKVTFTHIRRELNKEADKLANQAMDNARDI